MPRTTYYWFQQGPEKLLLNLTVESNTYSNVKLANKKSDWLGFLLDPWACM